MPDYPLTELRQSFEKTNKQEKIKIPRSSFFGNLEL